MNRYTRKEYDTLSEAIGNPVSVLKTVIDHGGDKVELSVTIMLNEYMKGKELDFPKDSPIANKEELKKEHYVYWKAVRDIIYQTPLKRVPLELNSEHNYVPQIARWRLGLGK